MSFKIGDKVAVLDEDISGIITEISGNHVHLETFDGFVFRFQAHELVALKTLTTDLFSDQSLSEIIKTKEQSRKKPKQNRKLPKSHNRPPLEIDLHIHKLTDHEHRMSNYEMLTLQLDTAKRQLEFAIRKNIQRVVFIHGVGDGVLRMEIETLLRRYDNLKFYDADMKTYGIGATEVYIYQNKKSLN